MRPTDYYSFRDYLLVGTPEVHEGDLVKITKGEQIRQARARRFPATGLCVAGGSIDRWIREGWRIEVVERAKPPVPTVPGLYTLNPEHPDRADVYRCTGEGTWERLGTGRSTWWVSGEGLRASLSDADIRSLTRLEATK